MLLNRKRRLPLRNHLFLLPVPVRTAIQKTMSAILSAGIVWIVAAAGVGVSSFLVLFMHEKKPFLLKGDGFFVKRPVRGFF